MTTVCEAEQFDFAEKSWKGGLEVGNRRPIVRQTLSMG